LCLPFTERFGRTELTLPLHLRLQPDDVDRVVRALAGAIEETVDQ
jgi:dTDP-4-amino-4,6-dideoxygalactose transaminase